MSVHEGARGHGSVGWRGELSAVYVFSSSQLGGDDGGVYGGRGYPGDWSMVVVVHSCDGVVFGAHYVAEFAE